jgi:hypothetical protein
MGYLRGAPVPCISPSPYSTGPEITNSGIPVVTYPRLKPGACPQRRGGVRAPALGDLMGSMSRSAGIYQPASKRSLRPESFARLRFAAPARAAVTAHRSTAQYPAAWRLVSSSRSQECCIGYSLCAYSKRVCCFSLLAQANRIGNLLPSGGRRFLSPLMPGAPAPHIRW